MVFLALAETACGKVVCDGAARGQTSGSTCARGDFAITPHIRNVTAPE